MRVPVFSVVAEAGVTDFSGQPSTLKSIQALRAIAACAVVFHHVCQPFQWAGASSPLFMQTRAITDFGQAGVDVFFVISGFIMVVITDRWPARDRRALNFLQKRATRVFPIYWIYTTVFLLMTTLPGVMANHLYPPAYVLRSYLLVPAYADGKAELLGWPVLGVGWTLSFEMLFYLVFAALIRLDVARSALIISAGFVLTGLAGWWFTPTASPLLAFVTHPLTLEFCLGMAAGLLYCRTNRVGPKSAWLATLAGGAWFAVTAVTPFDQNLRFVVWGVPAFLIVLGMSHLERWRGLRVPKPLLLLGDASYSIYLTHFFVILVVQTVLMKTKFGAWLRPVDFAIVGLTVLTLVPGVLSFWLIESPIIRWFAERGRRAKQASHPQAAVLVPQS